jgi:hypothetical protein
MISTIGTIASNQLTQEYTTILSQSNVAGYSRPSYINQLKQDTLIRSLKEGGSWNFIDVLYILANDESSGNFALLNWANPSLYSLTKINSPGFVSNRGYTSAGSTGFLSSSWAPSNGVNFQQNSASFGGMMYNNGVSTTPASALIGTNGTAQSQVYMLPRVVSTLRTTLNNATSNASTIPQNFMARRVLGVFRSSSTSYEQFYPSSSTADGFIIPNLSLTSTTTTTQQLNILSTYTTTRLYGGGNTASMFWAGGYQIRNTLTTFTSSMTTYINSI